MDEDLRDKLNETFGEHIVNSFVLVGTMLHNKCEDYALSKMKEDDFISLRDANYIKTNDIVIMKGKNKIISTLRKTSKDKYEDFYDEKLTSTIEKMTDAE